MQTLPLNKLWAGARKSESQKYYNTMILWYYSSDWSKLNPRLLYRTSWSWGSIQCHLAEDLRTWSGNSHSNVCVTESCAGAERFANDTPICQSSQNTTQVASHPEQRHWAAPHCSHSALGTCCLVTGTPTALGPSRRMLNEDKNALSSCGGKKTIEETHKRGWTYVGIKRVFLTLTLETHVFRILTDD